METFLYILIGLLSAAICALGGYWFFRSARADRLSAKPEQVARRAPKHDPWSQAMRASRDRL